MSFTADELQSFNDILEKKLAAHRREIERAFDQRLQTLRREIEQRFITAQREIITTLTQKLAEQQEYHPGPGLRVKTATTASAAAIGKPGRPLTGGATPGH